MPKWRKKPVVIEADQWFPGKYVEGLEEVNVESGQFAGETLVGIRTLEGFLYVSPGDYIITGVQGEKYPCTPAIFEQTYEPAEGE